jgi:putative AdoMet-dependent methyltransferase
MKSLNKGILYDKMVQEKSDDELGLFDKYEETFVKIREKILSYEVKTIVDFGCGTGNLCGPLSEKLNVIGIDKNVEMIEVGKRKYPKMKFVESSIFDAPIIKQKVDIAVSSYVLHGLNEKEQQQVLSNMLSISDNSRVILIDFMFENMHLKKEHKERFLRNDRKDLWEFIESKNFFIVEDLRKYIEQMGLMISFEHVGNFTWISEINL